MKFLLKSIIFILLIQNLAYGCTLCKADIPSIDVYTKIYNENNSTRFDIKWKFNKEFVAKLNIYDMNGNKKFEKEEQLLIEDSLVSYLKETNYLTDIIYLHKKDEFDVDKRLDVKPNTTKLEFVNDSMEYSYSFNLNITLQKDHKIYIGFYDMGGNFIFNLRDITLKDYNGYKRIEPDETYSYIYFYEKENEAVSKIEENKIETKSILKMADPKNTAIEKEQTIYEILAGYLEEIKSSLKELLQDIKDNNSITSYLWLLFFSFAYGIIHAMGPGHGKSLISAYFINQDKSYIKALNISLLIGVVHTFSAFLVTLIIYYMLETIFVNITLGIEEIAIKVSAVIIIGIALYMIYKRLSKKRTANLQFSEAKNVKSPLFTQEHTNSLSCSCSGCQTNSNDLAVVLAAGIVPCPGTVTVFIFTMSLGLYFVGFLSAIFMSLGMGLIIYITALLSIKVKRSANRNKTLVKILDYGSLLFILGLGIVLLVI